jgi:hypothetical protein
MAWHPDARRTKEAISRMNYLHGYVSNPLLLRKFHTDEASIYQKAGHISNDDLLYTLGLFALEPIRWIKEYEWREMTPMERCAM